MAFGFGFNKQKVLSAAEKFVQQGKVQNAIAEYEKVLKADPKDLTVMNTVGDLYSRLGDSEKAVACFKSVGDAYASQGFTVKAIAMYKKLSKSKPSLESVIRLAELYTQQGLFNDARAQYLQVAEEFLKAGELEQAVRIFQKTLEMDPENVAMRTRLAEVYVRLGKKTEAWKIFAAAAESLRGKGQLDAAEGILQRMITLDPGNSYALLLRGRNALDSGDPTRAIENLEKVADLDSTVEGLQALFQAYLAAGRLSDAGTSAGKLLAIHNDTAAIYTYADALISSGHFVEALQLYQQYSDRLLSSDGGRVLDSLHSIIGHVRENPAALETLLELFNRAGENTHLTEVYELLAHAYVQSGELEKARDFYLKLTQLEPQNQLHSDNYQQVLAKLGGTATSRLITAEEGTVLIDELEATAPFVDQRYDDQVALSVRAALTDAELFISYNMPAKALAPLLLALPQAPRDLRLNQRLAALHTRAGRFAEAAVCSRTLESIYHDAGYPDEASRYGELAVQYEERAAVGALESSEAEKIPAPRATKGREAADSSAALVHPVAPDEHALSARLPEITQAAAAPAPLSIPLAASSPAKAAPPSGLFFHAPVAPPSSQEPAEFEVQASPLPESEIDLSSEWDDSFSDEVALPAPSPLAASAGAPAHLPRPVVDNSQAVTETVDEIRFYLSQSMNEEAFAALDKLQQLQPEETLLAALRAEVEGNASHSEAVQPGVIEEISAADLAPVELSISEPHAVEAAPQALPEFAAAAQSAVEPELSFAMPSAVEAPAPTYPDATGLGDFVQDLDASLGEQFLPAAPAVQAPAAAALTSEATPSAHQELEHEVQAETIPEIEMTPQAGHISGLGDFVADLEASLGDGFLPAAAEVHPPTIANAPPAAARSEVALEASLAAPAAMAAAAPSASSRIASFTHPAPKPASAPEVLPDIPLLSTPAGIDLADMFGELKHELEEDAASSDEDPETHYNLGVAFREMGLLDEAIGELQKVCQSIDRGQAFSQTMQTYTWLAQCFLDKGIPEAAIRWYEQALKLPKLDQETRTALHYEIGGAYEQAGNKVSALSNFMQVYGSNIDYRDVAERIQALRS
jgi:tetratricopeptide (TPR) repeat protein